MPVVQSNVFIMDNGGHTIKAGYSTQSNPRIIPNSIMKAKSEKRRAFIGDQIDDCRDLSSLFYMLPFQKGFLVNWDHQKTIWDYLFGKHCFKLNASSLKLLLTEPYFNFSSIQEGLSEIFFEEYEFQSLFRTHPGDLVCYQNKVDHPGQQCCLVVDTGFSFTHVVPYVLGKRVRSAVRRIDVGGKLLTNHLKEVTSYRQLHVLDETYVMNTAKEDCCFVSQDVDKDLAIAKKRGKENTISRDYVLPDFTSIRRGFMKPQEDSTGRPEDGEQIIRLNNERFMVPEILMSPADIGIQQLGLAEAVVNSVSACEEAAQPWLYANIVLVGGCALFRGIRDRLERDVRTMAPQMMEVKVSVAGEGGVDPIQCAWRGGASLSKDTEFANLCVTREDYLEEGSVLWSVMTIAGTLMILVSLFTNRWLQGPVQPNLSSITSTFEKLGNHILDGNTNTKDLLENRLGLFPDCKAPSGRLLFEGECVPDWKTLMNKLFEMKDETYPHAWKGAVLAFGIGLGLMVLTVLLSLITPCLRSCICCSIFTVCGSLQSFAAILFTLGCVAYPAGWGSKLVKDEYCGQDAHPFMLGNCAIGGAYWMAVAGTICTALASSLAIFAYKSTKSQKAQIRRQEGDTFICVP